MNKFIMSFCGAIAVFLMACDSPTNPPDQPDPEPRVRVTIVSPPEQSEYELGAEVPCEVTLHNPSGVRVSLSYNLYEVTSGIVNIVGVNCTSNALEAELSVGSYRFVVEARGQATDSDTTHFSVVAVGYPPRVNITRPSREGWPFVVGNLIFAEVDVFDQDGDELRVTWFLNSREVGNEPSVRPSVEIGDSMLIAVVDDGHGWLVADTIPIYVSEKQFIFGGGRGDWDFYIADLGPDVGSQYNFFNLSRDREQKIHPVLSPDGSKLAWIGIGECDYNGVLMVGDYDYVGGREISRINGECIIDSARAPRFSPNGRRILFDGFWLQPNFQVTSNAMFVADLETDEVQRLPFQTCETPEDPNPCINSSRGNGVWVSETKVLFVVYEQFQIDYQEVLILWDVETGDMARLFETGLNPGTLTFMSDVSPDNRWVSAWIWHVSSVETDNGETTQAIIVRTDGSEIRELTPIGHSRDSFFYDNETVCYTLPDNVRILRCAGLDGSLKWETRYPRNIRSPRMIR